MKKIKLDDKQFISLYQHYGTAILARDLGVSERTIQRHKARIEQEYGWTIVPAELYQPERTARAEVKLANGIVLVGSDAHNWPGDPSTGHRGFVHVAKKLKPDIIVLNGDVLDGASISRHPPIGWEQAPTVADEMEVAHERLEDIEKAAPDAERIWTLGNHDARFETRLAQVAPEFRNVHGIHLKDHFPKWRPAWSVGINDNTIIKHRFKGGPHAAYNNVVASGRNIITGHLHSLKVSPYTDYNGTRYGVDGGMLAWPQGPQFTGYTEDNPLNWREGFVVLRFVDWQLRPPLLVTVVKNGVIDFNGEDVKV